MVSNKIMQRTFLAGKTSHSQLAAAIQLIMAFRGGLLVVGTPISHHDIHLVRLTPNSEDNWWRPKITLNTVESSTLLRFLSFPALVYNTPFHSPLIITVESSKYGSVYTVVVHSSRKFCFVFLRDAPFSSSILVFTEFIVRIEHIHYVTCE